MKTILIKCLCWLGRLIMSLRYKIRIEGLETIQKKQLNNKQGILFLPNHSAHVDPIFLIMLFWPRLKLHPVVIEYVYRQTGIHALMKLIGALSIPNLESSLNEIKLKNAEGVIQTIIEGVKKKKNFLLYPAGRLKHTGKEILGGASAVHTILNACPDTNVILVRTTGLWGSSFSRSYEGKSPDIKITIKRGIKYLLKNFIFFMPRRQVLIQVALADKSLPINKSRLELNKYLEHWYNQYRMNGKVYESEPLYKVSYSLWKKIYLEECIPKERQKIPRRQFSSQIEEDVFTFLSSMHPDVEINNSMHLANDLGMDSLDMAEVVNFLSVKYDVGEVEPEAIETVQDILELAAGKDKKVKREEKKQRFTWPEEKQRLNTQFPMGKTIMEAFLLTCDRMKNSLACADDIVGPLTYKKLKIAVLVLSEKIRKMPGEKIAVLLPASIPAYMIILAIEFANKIPVMLNWTLGPRYLNHMMKLTEAKRVISSWRFLERLSNVEFGDLVKDIHLLEDIKKSISKKDKLKALLLSFCKARTILRKLSLNKIDENRPAVILFTSGTEANPKGVPLSHKNLLSNQHSAMQCANLNAQDVMYGILPPFHSFGFSVAGLLPLLAGIKIAYYPDPTDSRALADGVERWKITIFCSAPSFLKSLFRAATSKQLKTVRLFVTGAERTPKELYQVVDKLGTKARLIEGYGITECSPILTLNRPNRKSVGVGQLLPGIEFCTIDPETFRQLEEGQEGEICVRGDNVFSGYLGETKSPFIEIKGEQWYGTGDLGYMDKEGNIILSGRLKRFAKIGGEMISLTGVETIIAQNLNENSGEEDNPHIAVCAKEVEGDKSTLILFATIDMDKNDANSILREAGFSRLVKISEIRHIDAIPIMGSGKVDYRFLQSMIEE